MCRESLVQQALYVDAILVENGNCCIRSSMSVGPLVCNLQSNDAWLLEESFIYQPVVWSRRHTIVMYVNYTGLRCMDTMQATRPLNDGLPTERVGGKRATR